MKKIALILVILVLGTTVLVGCPSTTPAVTETPQPSVNGVVEPPPVPPEDTNWINPGKVTVTNFYPGARAENALLIYNGNDEPTTFSITVRQPDSLKDGYEMPPLEALGWVSIDYPQPTLEAGETKELLVALEMPEEEIAPEQWEFWVSVIDTSQTGTVITELASRWLITMRD